MKYLITLFSALVISVTAFAAAPSKESVEKLLAAAESEKLVTSMQQQIENMMKASVDRAFKGQALSAEAQQFVDNYRKKMIGDFKAEMSWEKLKDLYVQIYSESFTQEEIDGLIAFYD